MFTSDYFVAHDSASRLGELRAAAATQRLAPRTRPGASVPRWYARVQLGMQRSTSRTVPLAPCCA